MAAEFQYDVFLSHSAKDEATVRPLAERLWKDGVRVWFDGWELKPGDSIPPKIEEGLEHSRVLVLCMSAHAFGSDWASLEAGTFRFRDPLNKDRRFIPLRLDDAPIKGSLAQFLCINWRPAHGEQEYAKLLKACRPLGKAVLEAEMDEQPVMTLDANKGHSGRAMEGHGGGILAATLSADGQILITGSRDKSVRVWDLATGECIRMLVGHAGSVREVVLDSEGRIYSASEDRSVKVWNMHGGELISTLTGHSDAVYGIALTPDEGLLVSASKDRTMRLWNVEKMSCERVIHYSKAWVNAVVVSSDGRNVLAGTEDGFVTSLEITGKQPPVVIGQHSSWVWGLALARRGSRLVSASGDCTVGLWDTNSGKFAILEGHTDRVSKVAITRNGRWAASGSLDKTVRIWDLNARKCVMTLMVRDASVESVAMSGDGRLVISGSDGLRGGLRVWHVSEYVTDARTPNVTVPALPLAPDQVSYTNAKVLLVGESGVGKTGLSKRLASDVWEPSDSTVGAWATQWKLPVASGQGVEREIWLWDFGGQADQRLIHQLYMDETALAVLVFDGQKEDIFETLGQWDRDLARASRGEFAKLLVAGRVDAGRLRVSRTQIEAFKKERGYLDFLETSAKSGLRCEELKQAILQGIRWEDIPWRSSPLLFKRLKDEIIKLKEAGRVLMRFNELRETLQLRLSEAQSASKDTLAGASGLYGNRFTDEELRAVVSLLAGPGVVWELKFGSWVLLQPERINAYAQAVIQTLRADEDERGCIAEERVLDGGLTYHRPQERLPADEERFVLLAMHKILVERGLCLREHTDDGTMLIFPSYYRRERPELVGHPAALVSYRFNGFLDDIYATLVVRLHHTKPFKQDRLWRYAADFKTLTGKQLGVKLERRAEGAGELVVYADPAIADAERIIFSRYVHEHILQKGRDMVRLRNYVCPHCCTPVGNREVAMERLTEWLANRPADAGLAGKIKAAKGKAKPPTIICSKCEQRVPLWDELEQYFASDEVKERVRQLQAESDLMLDNESKDRALVGEVISTVALAGQIIEEYSAKRYGLDGEIEFRDDVGKPTARKLYLQLKSGDSHLRKRQSDGAEIFPIHHKDHATYWMKQAYPVFLVIANSQGEVRWMEIRDYLRRESDNGKKPVKQIVFEGERFDVMSVRRWRDKVLGAKP